MWNTAYIVRGVRKNAKAFLVLAIVFPLFQNCGGQKFKAANFSSESTPSSSSLPDIRITEPAANLSFHDTITLKGQCAANINVEISGDVGAPFAAVCESGNFAATVDLSGVDGGKSVVVTQRDSRGNVKADSRAYIKDTVAPLVSILGLASGAFVKGQVVASGSCENGLAVNLKIGAVTSAVTCTNGMFSGTLNIQSIADGAISLEVRQTDNSALTTTQVLALMKDTVAPAVAISSPAASSVVTSPLALSGTCETGLDVTIAGTGAASSFSTECLNGAFSANVNLTTGQGNKLVTVAQTDRAGNAGSGNRTFQVQGTAPTVSIAITSPAANSLAKAGVTLIGTCQNGLAINISGTGVQAASSATCTNGAFSQAITFSAGEGNKTVTVTQTDGTASGFDTRTFIKDSVAPALTIVAPLANASTKANITVSGACENGLPVNIAGTGVASALSATCSSGTYSSSVSTSAGDGAKQITVTQTDAATNVTTKSVSVVRDTANPAITITGPAAGTSSATGVTVTGACETGLTVTASGTDLTSSATASCTNSAYSVAVLFAGADGAKSVTVSQTDAAGNSGSAQRSFTKTTLPVVYDGAALYTTNCAVCHGPLSTSTKIGKTASEITLAITNVPSMNLSTTLKALNAAQVQAIADALSSNAAGDKIIQCVAGKVGSATDMRRLTKGEYVNTVRDLLGTTVFADLQNYISQLPEDSITNSVSDFQNQYSTGHLQVFADLALGAANSITATDAKLNALLSANSTCTNYTTVTTTCVTDFINRFGLKVHRRPLTSADVTWYQGIYNSGASNKEKFFSLLLVYLQMPEFLYHVEVGTAGSGTNAAFDISPYETVNRMSYMLWGTMPSDALFQKAAAGDVNDPVKLGAMLESMMQDARAKTRVTDFFSFWLKLNSGNVPNFPTLTAYLNGINTTGLYTEMLREMNQYVLYEVFDAKKGYQDLMTSKVSFAKSSSLATIYGHALSSTPDNAQQVMGAGRKGLLMRGPLLAYGDTENHPLRRGALIRKRVLCDQLGDPPAGATMANPETETLPYIQTMTTRQRMALKTGSADCMGCHAHINPMGFALEEFDSLGRRTLTERNFSRDDGSLLATHTIDPVVNPLGIDGVGTGVSNSADEFATSIANSDKGVSCMSRQMFRFYKIQMESLTDDGCVLASMRDTMSGSSGSIYESLKKMISDTNFRKKLVKP